MAEVIKWDEMKSLQIGLLEDRVLAGSASPEEIAEYQLLATEMDAWVCAQPWFSICGAMDAHDSHEWLGGHCDGQEEDK